MTINWLFLKMKLVLRFAAQLNTRLVRICMFFRLPSTGRLCSHSINLVPRVSPLPFPGSLLFPPPGAREERPWLGLVTCLLGNCNPNEGSPVLPCSCCVTFYSKHQPCFLNDLMFAASRPTRLDSYTFILGIDQVYDNEYSTQFPRLWITRIYSPSSTEKWQT